MASRRYRQPRVLAVDPRPEVRALLRELLAAEEVQVTTRAHLAPDLTDIAAVDPDLIVLGSLREGADDEWAALKRLARDPDRAQIPVIVCALPQRDPFPDHPGLAPVAPGTAPAPFDVDHFRRVVRDVLATSALWRLTRPRE
jgi:DNA-binding NarL/FixJ family response regulator